MEKNILLEEGGCGVTATTDLILYLSLMNSRYNNISVDVTYDSEKKIEYESYIKFYKTIAFDYIDFPTLHRESDSSWISLWAQYDRLGTEEESNKPDFPGLYATDVTRGFNRYNQFNSIFLYYNSLDYYDSDIPSISSDIKGSIRAGVPVIFKLNADEQFMLYEYNEDNYIRKSFIEHLRMPTTRIGIIDLFPDLKEIRTPSKANISDEELKNLIEAHCPKDCDIFISGKLWKSGVE